MRLLKLQVKKSYRFVLSESEYSYGEGKVLRRSSEVAEVFKTLHSMEGDAGKESVYIIVVDAGNRILATKKLFDGGASCSIVDPKIILRFVLQFPAVGFMLCHNHPSGSLLSSEQDNKITQKVNQAAGFLDLKFLDHVIIGDGVDGFYSYSDSGIL